MPFKITLYRLVQEALNNAYRYAGGVGQQVYVGCMANQLQVPSLLDELTERERQILE